MNGEQSIQAAATGSHKAIDAAQKAKLQKAVREFEAIFVGYVLKSMRNTVEKADNSTDGLGANMLEGMFDVELAKHISRSGNLGLAEMLYRKMTGESLGNSDAAPPAPAPRVNQKEAPFRKSKPEGPPPGVASTGWSSKTLDERLRSYDRIIEEASEKFGVKDSLIRAVIAAESGARPDALSAKNAKGLMQLIDSTAAEMGVRNVWDPRENILGGSKYLKQLLEQFDGDEKLALASYNAGPSAVRRHGGVPPYKETREYVVRVLSFVELMEHKEDHHE